MFEVGPKKRQPPNRELSFGDEENSIIYGLIKRNCKKEADAYREGCICLKKRSQIIDCQAEIDGCYSAVGLPADRIDRSVDVDGRLLVAEKLNAAVVFNCRSGRAATGKGEGAGTAQDLARIFVDCQVDD